MAKEGFSDWFKENIPKEGLSENTTFTRQFLIDAWHNGYNDGFRDGVACGEDNANKWHKADVPTSHIDEVVLGYINDYNEKKFCLVKWNGEWWEDAGTYNDRVKLIAWKKIVFPEPPKENV